MRSNAIILLLITAITFQACNVNNSSNSKPQNLLETSIKPAKSGSIQISGSNLYARAKAGYYFKYWKLIKQDNALGIAYNDSIRVTSDSVKSAKAVFAPTDLDIINLPSTSDGRYVYFETEMYVTVDTVGHQKSVYAFVQADLTKDTKQKIYITDKLPRHFDVSSDNRYIAFSSYSTGINSSSDIDTYLYDRKLKKLQATNSGGINVLWSHHSDSLLIGAKNGIYIYDAKYDQLERLSTPSGTYHRTEGFKTAAWSPDDVHIVLYRDGNVFQVYDISKLERTDIRSDHSKRFFIWLDNQSFITNNSDASHSLKYSLNHLAAPKQIHLNDPIGFDNLGFSISPSRTEIAYISNGSFQNGIDIYNPTSGKTENILNYAKYDPLVLNWAKIRTILFYGRNGDMIKVMTPDGNVSLL